MVLRQLDGERWEVDAREHYWCHPHHRNGNSQKSQWSITRLEEVSSFAAAPKGVCSDPSVRWGTHFANASIAALGSRGEWLARFVGDGAIPISTWHGWPACRWPQDNPDSELLDHWVQHGVITRARARRVNRGIWQL